MAEDRELKVSNLVDGHVGDGWADICNKAAEVEKEKSDSSKADSLKRQDVVVMTRTAALGAAGGLLLIPAYLLGASLFNPNVKDVLRPRIVLNIRGSWKKYI